MLISISTTYTDCGNKTAQQFEEAFSQCYIRNVLKGSCYAHVRNKLHQYGTPTDRIVCLHRKGYPAVSEHLIAVRNGVVFADLFSQAVLSFKYRPFKYTVDTSHRRLPTTPNNQLEYLSLVDFPFKNILDRYDNNS